MFVPYMVKYHLRKAVITTTPERCSNCKSQAVPVCRCTSVEFLAHTSVPPFLKIRLERGVVLPLRNAFTAGPEMTRAVNLNKMSKKGGVQAV